MVRDTDAFVGLGNKLVANADKAQANDLLSEMNVASLSGRHSIIWNKSEISVSVINSVWISDGESLAKLYKMLDKSETELNELRGLE
ncbi:hypothetical protein IMAU80188_03054 [Lactiplantibacillus plantarum]|nr:hypothetical protein [Lactiplantibacillus plantarum]MCG0619407.1 hypothetical protein [Lactiplantibacillus plantarum]MCG0807857.1 hypothetical protein [Lactiplantibacillus plantarum]MCG0832826.1 hypothetical protein [Lactiplantibacillus plantarum]MCG0851597.1 hypothetical protein [Lactiplantibacillus plantarum]